MGRDVITRPSEFKYFCRNFCPFSQFLVVFVDIIIIIIIIIYKRSDIKIGYSFVIKLTYLLSQRSLEAITYYNIKVCRFAYFFRLASVLAVQSFRNRQIMFTPGRVVWVRMFDIDDSPYDNNAKGSTCFDQAVARYKMTDSRNMPKRNENSGEGTDNS